MEWMWTLIIPIPVTALARYKLSIWHFDWAHLPPESRSCWCLAHSRRSVNTHWLTDWGFSQTHDTVGLSSVSSPEGWQMAPCRVPHRASLTMFARHPSIHCHRMDSAHRPVFVHPQGLETPASTYSRVQGRNRKVKQDHKRRGALLLCSRWAWLPGKFESRDLRGSSIPGSNVSSHLQSPGRGDKGAEGRGEGVGLIRLLWMWNSPGSLIMTIIAIWFT